MTWAKLPVKTQIYRLLRRIIRADEDIGTIISDILWGIAKTEGRYAVIKDRAEAIRYALEHAEEGDIVLLAGKGQQKFEEIRGVKYPFDERQVVKDFYDAL